MSLDTPQSLEQTLASVSIRGRVAFCLLCVEYALQSEPAPPSELAPILAAVWEFTHTTNLGQWDDMIRTVAGDVMNHADYLETGRLSAYQLPPDSPLRSVAGDILRMIGATIDIGIDELYGSIPQSSPGTLQRTLDVVHLMAKHDWPLPNVQWVAYSRFTEAGGWGVPFNANQLRSQALAQLQQ